MKTHPIRWTLGLLSVLLALAVWLPSAVPAFAASEGEAEAMVSRLSDQEVRDLLIKQLADKKSGGGSASEGFNPAITIYRLQRDAGTLSKSLHKIFGSVGELGTIAPRAWASFSADRQQGSLGNFFLAMLVSFGIGAVGAVALRTKLRRALAGLDQRSPDRLRVKVATLGTGLLVDLICVAVFAALASAIFVAFFSTPGKDRIAFFFYLAAAGIFVGAIAAARAFYAPHRPELRVQHYDDAGAMRLYRATLLTIGFGAFGFFTCALSATLGVGGEVHKLFLILVGSITMALLMFTIGMNRLAISGDICALSPDPSLRRRVAGLWPWIFAVAVAVIWMGLVADQLLSDFVPYGGALFTIALMAVAPSVDALFYREKLKYQAAGDEMRAVLARGARFANVVMIAISLSIAWKLNPFAAGAAGSTGSKIASAGLQVSITLLVAYVVWQFVRILIDSKIAAEDAELLAQGIDVTEAEIGGEGLSRTRTLLPLLKRTIQVTLFSMAAMIVLAALGVNIAPLLAGAGVVGLAIGFGSQTLVRDIVSGAFFLIDDAFRIGEYIDVGAVKGVVEKMSVRSIRLRHHRGAVHTVPFGEVATLTNYSRDWAIMKHRIRVPFDTDVDKVRKLMKKVGLELAEVPEIKDDFLQPFKSQGAVEVDDYGFVISTKFMSKPGKQFVIRRYVFAAIQKAFKENGLEFAVPNIEVSTDDDDDRARPSANQVEAKKAGAAAALAAQTRPAAE